MNEPTLGTSTLLPGAAADCLVNAARRARSLPNTSIARRREIEAAIATVRAQWPEYFRENGGGGLARLPDRGGLAGGKVH